MWSKSISDMFNTFKILHGFEGISKTMCCPLVESGRFYVKKIDSFIRSMHTRLDSYRRGAPFVCRALFLTPYGLKVVLILLKRQNFVLRGPEIDHVNCIGRATATHPTGNRTA